MPLPTCATSSHFSACGRPTRRRLAEQALADLPPPAEAQLAAATRLLWQQPEREFQYAGCDLLAEHVAVAGPGFIDVAHELVVTRSWWDTVDALATHTVGPLVRRHSELASVMDDWIRSENIWVARTALLHQLTYRADTDADRLFAYCRTRVADPEFFIRKAIGWALRTYAAHEPERVADVRARHPVAVTAVGSRGDQGRRTDSPTARTLTGQTEAGCLCSRWIHESRASLDSKLVISA